MLDELLKYRIITGQILSAIFSISTLIVLGNYAEWHPLATFAATVAVYLAVPKLWDIFLGILQGRY